MAMEYAVAQLPHQTAAGPPDQHPAAHPTPVSQRTRGSSLMRQQRRLALEQEVAELKQQLSNEETVHHILERALLQPTREGGGGGLERALLQPIREGGQGVPVVAVSSSIIPGKTKELLAELVLVEQEIARLEAQIKHMKGGLVAMQQQRRASAAAAASDNTIVPSTNGGSSSSPRTTSADIKSMFFIAQAMDGEYLKRHLADHDRRNKQDSSRHSHSLDDATTNSNSKKMMMIRHDQLPIIMKDQTRPPPPPAGAAGNKRLQPNKLSERILKCLVCIFIRLLRSSRAADLQASADKSGAGNNNNSFSFRIDTGLNVAAGAGSVVANNKLKDKDRQGQQDHYGIFAIQDAIVRDIGPYKNLVSFTSSSCSDLQRGFSSSPLLTKLRGMLEALHQVDVSSLNHQQKLAFWINVYNTCIMHGILQHGLPSNSEKLLALKNKATINVSGQMFNALVIENLILRQPSSVKQEFWRCDVDVDEQEVRGLYGLTTSEPNILFALCCGIRSSPALRIYKADRVLVDLEKAKLDYLQASLVVTSSSRRLLIPSLIHSNMHDFAKGMESLVRWLCEQLPTSWSLRKSMVDCLRTRAAVRVHDVVDVIPLDYDFQYLLPM